MLHQTQTPYANLDPHLILDAIESVGFRCDGSLFALNSFENRVYQVGIEDSAPLIAKFYRPNRWSDAAILEEHQFALELLEHEIPVVAPIASANGRTLEHYQNYRFALFPRKGGRTIELDNLEHLEWMGRFIGRLHAVGACKRFEHRIQLTVQNYGYDSYHYLLEHSFVPEALLADFKKTVTAVLLQAEQKFAEAGELNIIRLHGDCHAGNVLWNDAGPQIVDLDDCLSGPAIQDIWMLLTGETKEQVSLQLNCILRGYEEFYDFNDREIHLIPALRALRRVQYTAWLAKRWEDPAFPLNFPWFNTIHYWSDLIQDLHDQLTF